MAIRSSRDLPIAPPLHLADLITFVQPARRLRHRQGKGPDEQDDQALHGSGNGTVDLPFHSVYCHPAPINTPKTSAVKG